MTRYIAKLCGGTWNVYDTERASYPALMAGVGKVEQAHKTEEAAEAEAARLNEWVS